MLTKKKLAGGTSCFGDEYECTILRCRPRNTVVGRKERVQSGCSREPREREKERKGC